MCHNKSVSYWPVNKQVTPKLCTTFYNIMVKFGQMVFYLFGPPDLVCSFVSGVTLRRELALLCHLKESGVLCSTENEDICVTSFWYVPLKMFQKSGILY